MMLPNEQEIIEKLHIHYNKYYVPFVWASTLVVKSRRQGLIKDDFAVQTILDVPTTQSVNLYCKNRADRTQQSNNKTRKRQVMKNAR